MKVHLAKPVFVVGCPRSGTTWVHHLLLSSGGFAIYRSESQIYNQFAPWFGNFRNENHLCAFLDVWLQSEYFLRSGLNASEFRRQCSKINGPGSFLKHFMTEICMSQQAARWADCTPEYALYLQAIKRDFPDALIIHVIRDGRDVALSLAKQKFIESAPWERNLPEVTAACYWGWINRKIFETRAFLGDDLLTIHYEDLLEDLGLALQRIGDFIGKSISLDRINNQKIGTVHTPNSSFPNKSVDKNGNLACERNKGIIETIEMIIGPELLRFGYSTSQTGGSLHSFLRRLPNEVRFRLGMLGREIGLARPDFSKLVQSTDGDDVDPTLRPGRNQSLIQTIVND